MDLLDRFTVHDDEAAAQYANRTQPIKYWYVHAKNVKHYWTMWRALMSRLTVQQRTMISDEFLKKWTTT